MRLSFVGYGPDGDETSPIAEPITLAHAKAQVRREEVTDDDAFLETILIPAVRNRGEQETHRQFITAVWDLKLDRFPWPCDVSPGEEIRYPQGVIKVPKAPLQEVTYIKYVDGDGVLQTWSSSNYLVDAPTGEQASRGRITPAYGVSWPSTRDQINAVTVRFVAGYGDTDTSVPARLKIAMLVDLGTQYENREDFVGGQGYSVSEFPTGSSSIYRAFRSY
jgi:uncharacterized phiE125 gp8 family phage protein